MIIKTDVKIKDLKGEEIKVGDGSLTLGVALSNILGSAKEGGKMKLYSLAMKLYNEKNVVVDESDLGLIKTVTKSTEIYMPLISGQCLLLLEDVKEEVKGK